MKYVWILKNNLQPGITFTPENSRIVIDKYIHGILYEPLVSVPSILTLRYTDVADAAAEQLGPLQGGLLTTSFKWGGLYGVIGVKNPRQTHLFQAIYKGPTTPFITIVGAHLVENELLLPKRGSLWTMPVEGKVAVP